VGLHNALDHGAYRVSHVCLFYSRCGYWQVYHFEHLPSNHPWILRRPAHCRPVDFKAGDQRNGEDHGSWPLDNGKVEIIEVKKHGNCAESRDRVTGFDLTGTVRWKSTRFWAQKIDGNLSYGQESRSDSDCKTSPLEVREQLFVSNVQKHEPETVIQ